MTLPHNRSPFDRFRRGPRNIFPYIRYTTVRPPRKLWHSDPDILLRGEWLNEAGFHPNWRIKVTVFDGKLVLEPLARPLGFFVALKRPIPDPDLRLRHCAIIALADHTKKRGIQS